MAQEHKTPAEERVIIVRGADDQLTALEHLWADGDTADLQADEEAWQTLRHGLNTSRKAAGARLLFDE